ncbi:hypothetical protein [Zunongwangia profunda]|uniref:hypothetical protein n=1 Tax=Zunongwangia profunda TaxID=398743 RepID=UPI001D18C656|nr:hypothetical protein [Zunongwangia profunda]MCC4229313.1 hypothetical protein [Zunongwangia profunda]|tara:strand:- start:823 stop:987 length:165 start_codon:yes stop_codon:yes gene_type:complete
MNKIRIVGVIFLIVGLVLTFFLRHTEVYFFAGILMGLGLLWAITGKTKRTKTRD